MANKIATLILICLSTSLCFSTVSASIGEVDKVAVVTRVVDGDTFDIDSGDRVRFADVNSSESGQAGYQVAKDFVAGLVEGKTVYLDIDDKYTIDTTGTRLVAVIYLSYNSTHYMNLNKALLDNHYATVWDHDNEFNPNDWSLFVSTPFVPEFPELMIITAFIVLLSVSAIILRVNNNKQR